MLTHGSLFSGIGGFDLGFQWAGIKTIWQVELDGYCRKVLERHFPGATRFTDVREVHGIMAHANLNGTKRNKSQDGTRSRLKQGCENCLPPVDILSGGFPCQDISVAGKQTGIDGERSGLWSEFHRIIGELRPRYVVIENVANLVRLGLERVLSDLASIGYDAEWQIISANDVGAPHLRKRIWIVAYPHGVRWIKNEDAGKNLRERRSLPQKTWDFNGTSVGFENSDRLWCFPDTTLERNLDGFAYWVDRLECCGNGVVPQQSIPAWEEIKRLSSLAYG